VSTIALTPTSYLVLGCLATAGPSTPYDLKQAVTGGVGYFWSFPHSQLYSEPARLAEAGLVAEEREQDGRRRRTFSITETGRRALQDWLADPSADLPDIRDSGLLKLFFGEHASTEQIVALACNQRDAHQQRLDLYQSLAELQAIGPAGATIGLGLAWERAATSFWTDIADHPPQP
jgi:PadR family transcriptional regulator, regulatory protein AphA